MFRVSLQHPYPPCAYSADSYLVLVHIVWNEVRDFHSDICIDFCICECVSLTCIYFLYIIALARDPSSCRRVILRWKRAVGIRHSGTSVVRRSAVCLLSSSCVPLRVYRMAIFHETLGFAFGSVRRRSVSILIIQRRATGVSRSANTSSL